jgi:DDE superfamily endonuclease/Helix-turn-helix of DDE superfamily endonuclease
VRRVIVKIARSAVGAERRITGLSQQVLAELVVELGPRWQAVQQDRLAGRPRRRAVGAGARYQLVFVDRLLATLVQLRHGVTQDVLAAWFGVHRSTISRAVSEIRPLLAERGCAVEGGQRLRTLADVIAYLGACPQTAIMDATEIRVRRPAAGRPGRDRYVSGKSKQNTVKALVITDHCGRLLFCGETRPGSTADITQARQTGLVDLLAHHPTVELLADAGYQGLGAQTLGAVITPRPRRRKAQLPLLDWIEAAHTAERKQHASRRIRVEHGIAHLKNWRVLARHHGLRETLDATVRAVASLVSDHQHSTRPTHRLALPVRTA